MPQNQENQSKRPIRTYLNADTINARHKQRINLLSHSDSMQGQKAKKAKSHDSYGAVVSLESGKGEKVKVRNSSANTKSSRGAIARKRLSKSKIQKGSVWDEIADTIQYLLEKAGFAIGNMTGVGKNLSIDPRLKRTYGLERGEYDLPIAYNPTRLSNDDKYLRDVVGKIVRHYMDEPSQLSISVPNGSWRDSLLSDMIPSALSPASREQYESWISRPNTFTNSGYSPRRWKKFKTELGLGSAAAAGATGAAIAIADSLKEKTKSNSIANSSMYKHMDGKPQPLKYATPFKNKFSK